MFLFEPSNLVRFTANFLKTSEKVAAVISSQSFFYVDNKFEFGSKSGSLCGLENVETSLYENILPNIDYSVYKDKPVILKGCSKKPVPLSAYIMALQLLQPFAKSIMYGEACSAVPLFKAVKKNS